MSNCNSVNTVKILHISLYNVIYKCMYVSLVSQQKVAVDAYLPKIIGNIACGDTSTFRRKKTTTNNKKESCFNIPLIGSRLYITTCGTHVLLSSF